MEISRRNVSRYFNMGNMYSYFETKNIHFYVNKCGFHIVEFYNKYHKDPNEPIEEQDEDNDGMFRFEKYCVL